jgi:hypothetical protein
MQLMGASAVILVADQESIAGFKRKSQAPAGTFCFLRAM